MTVSYHRLLHFENVEAEIFNLSQSNNKGQTAAQDQRILNGDEVGQGEFPFIVSITILDEHICGGFIYSTTYVMTAASCVDGYHLIRELKIII